MPRDDPGENDAVRSLVEVMEKFARETGKLKRKEKTAAWIQLPSTLNAGKELRETVDGIEEERGFDEMHDAFMEALDKADIPEKLEKRWRLMMKMLKRDKKYWEKSVG